MAQYDGRVVGTCMNCGMALREYSKHVEVRFSDGAAPASAYYCEDCAPFIQSKGEGAAVGNCEVCDSTIYAGQACTAIPETGTRPGVWYNLYCKNCSPDGKSKAEARVTLSDIPMMVAQHYEDLRTHIGRELVEVLVRDYHAHLLSIATVGNLPKEPTEIDDDGWTSVHDMMPEPKKRVLVWHEGMGSADAGAWWPAEQRIPAAWYDDTGGRYSDGKVTHWQPLPGKPKGLE